MRRVPGLPRRRRDAHKGDFGTTGVIAGSARMLGAAILCARAALRGGAGLVRAVLPGPLCTALMAAVPGATTIVRKAGWDEALRECDALVVGPGLGAGPATARLVRSVLAHARAPLVLDADALNVLAPLGPAGLRAAASVVLTPHPGEASRLLRTTSRAIQQDRVAAVAALASRSRQVVVLKGAATLVCEGKRLYTNATGNPGLATGGTGDVLAGLLGALLAQGLPAFEAACLAVRVHGLAGDLVAGRLSEAGLCAEDLPLAIAEVLGR